MNMIHIHSAVFVNGMPSANNNAPNKACRRTVLLITRERPPFDGAELLEDGLYLVRVAESEAEAWLSEHKGAMFLEEQQEWQK